MFDSMGTEQLHRVRKDLNSLIPSDTTYVAALGAVVRHMLDEEIAARAPKEKAEREAKEAAAKTEAEREAKEKEGMGTHAVASTPHTEDRPYQPYRAPFAPAVQERPPTPRSEYGPTS
jgi:septal ring factor EnvC (AmiA/AmiB activator)